MNRPRTTNKPTTLTLLALMMFALPARASDLDEFKVKREQVFEFAQPPKITRQGDNITITFASKGRCDVTVVIEEIPGAAADGNAAARPRIVRHLACGVLGGNAPPPLQKNSLRQTLVWDGKDDQGRYIDAKDAVAVRVSLGLKARFERTLFWFPKRRASRFPPLMAAAPNGVYVFDGGGSLDFLRLYSHDGEYVRTVYPFPADRIGQTKGLFWHTFPQDRRRLPIKSNFTQMTMLTSGTNSYKVLTYRPDLKAFRSVVGNSDNAHYGMYGGAGSAMAVRAGRIALAHIFLNRLATDGTTGGLPLTGPKLSMPIKNRGHLNRNLILEIPPRSAALSPDGNTLYLTGFVFAHSIGKASADIITNSNWDAFHAVTKLDIAKGTAPQVFVGSTKLGDHGTDDRHLKVPTSVATDRQGRVYVSDFLNNRVQVFTPDGKRVKTIPTRRPARVAVHQQTGEIYVFSWTVLTALDSGFKRARAPKTLTRFGPLPEAKKQAAYSLDIKGLPSSFATRYGTTFFEYFAELDSWAKEPTVWLVQDWAMSNVITRKNPRRSNIVILKIQGDKLVVASDFGKELARANVPGRLHQHHRQRLYVNPRSGKVHLTEGGAFTHKSFKQTWAIDPATGRLNVQQLTFDAEDMAFDANGLAYLRTVRVVARYDASNTWREVPWDYGEEYKKVHTSSSSDRRETPVVSGLPLPANGGWHHGGMFVSSKKHLAVACNYEVGLSSRTDPRLAQTPIAKEWTPRIYPGRSVAGRGGGVFTHVWDPHGKPVRTDLFHGLADNSYGIGLDTDDNLYLLAAATRVLDGKLYFNDMTGTLMKVRPGKARILSASDRAPVPLAKSAYHRRPFDLQNAGQGSAWVEGVDWMYGGVGWCGKNRGTGCACFNTRFAFDYLARSFAPEMDRYSVAVLDASGNLILRIGTYGNADDGLPVIKNGGPPAPRSLSGDGDKAAVWNDQVALFHGAYLATHTDRRLFISDPGNGRIVSVELGYHASKTVALKDVPDQNK